MSDKINDVETFIDDNGKIDNTSVFNSVLASLIDISKHDPDGKIRVAAAKEINAMMGFTPDNALPKKPPKAGAPSPSAEGGTKTAGAAPNSAVSRLLGLAKGNKGKVAVPAKPPVEEEPPVDLGGIDIEDGGTVWEEVETKDVPTEMKSDVAETLALLEDIDGQAT